MNPELIGERQYVQSLLRLAGVWVLMRGNAVYLQKSERGNCIRTWISKDDAVKFSTKLDEVDLSGIFVPLDVFLSGWLTSKDMNITEIMASPRYGFPALTYSREEFVNAFKT
jgi:hypothetical protein